MRVVAAVQQRAAAGWPDRWVRLANWASRVVVVVAVVVAAVVVVVVVARCRLQAVVDLGEFQD
jgi:hypothetical protein